MSVPGPPGMLPDDVERQSMAIIQDRFELRRPEEIHGALMVERFRAPPSVACHDDSVLPGLPSAATAVAGTLGPVPTRASHPDREIPLALPPKRLLRCRPRGTSSKPKRAVPDALPRGSTPLGIAGEGYRDFGFPLVPSNRTLAIIGPGAMSQMPVEKNWRSVLTLNRLIRDWQQTFVKSSGGAQRDSDIFDVIRTAPQFELGYAGDDGRFADGDEQMIRSGIPSMNARRGCRCARRPGPLTESVTKGITVEQNVQSPTEASEHRAQGHPRAHAQNGEEYRQDHADTEFS